MNNRIKKLEKKIVISAEEEIGDIKNIFYKIRNKDFSGNTGQAIKNSSYQLATTTIAKVGSILFTMIVARLLLPELYGLYGLALSTIVLFMAFSDFGIGTTLLTFITKSIWKNEKKSKAYYDYLLKYKLILTIIVSFFLIISSYFIANYYYNKPIFYALLIGVLYIPANQIMNYFGILFIAKNNFKISLINEIIFQFIRLTLIPIAIILFLGKIKNEYLIAIIFIIISLSYLAIALFLSVKMKSFRKIKSKKLTKKEKLKINNFIFPVSITALSGTFFGSIDMIMLGHFVESEFIGFYSVAFGLIGSATAIIAFSGTALFPILNKLKGKNLESGFRKSAKITFLISILVALFTFLFSEIIIKLIYGNNYQNSIILLKIFSLALITIPLSGLYNSYYLIKNDTKKYAILLIISTIINIILNYILIILLLPYGMLSAVIGACIATLISKYVHLFCLIVFKK